MGGASCRMTAEVKTSLVGTTYKVVEAYEAGKIRLAERKVQALKPLQVLVKVAFCGECVSARKSGSRVFLAQVCAVAMCMASMDILAPNSLL